MNLPGQETQLDVSDTTVSKPFELSHHSLGNYRSGMLPSCSAIQTNFKKAKRRLLPRLNRFKQDGLLL